MYKRQILAEENDLESCKLSSLKLLSNLHEKFGNFQESIQFHKAHTTQQNNLHLHTKEELILELETKYQLDRKEIENIILQTQQEKIKAELKTTYAIIATIVAGLIAILIFAFFLLRSNKIKQNFNNELKEQVDKRTKDLKRTNSKLLKSNAELERFAYIASHDLKTPLRNMISFTSLIEHHLKDYNLSLIHI